MKAIFCHSFYRGLKRFLQPAFQFLIGALLALVLWVFGFVLFLLVFDWLDNSTSLHFFL